MARRRSRSASAWASTPARRRPRRPGLVGIDINRAARIAAAAHGGQIVVSDAVRTLVAPDLRAASALRGLGNHRLKDLREPQPLCQVVADGLRLEFPPLRSLDARPNNLPTQLTSFVGRERELAEAGALLGREPARDADRARRHRQDAPVAAGRRERRGATFPTASSSSPSRRSASRRSCRRGWRRRSASPRPARPHGRRGPASSGWPASRSLFVLDNFEQVLDAGPIVADLLRAARRAQGARRRRAPRSASPASRSTRCRACRRRRTSSQLTALERAQPAGRERARSTPRRCRPTKRFACSSPARRAVRPGFEVTNENAPAVAAICARLHGMPLAIELAAARVKLLSPDAILARLEHQLSLLAAGSRDLPERQQTLRGAIAWSYDILDEACRLLLDRLVGLRGRHRARGRRGRLRAGIRARAARSSTASLSLADQSLHPDRRGPAATRASQMLETIREFAAEMLDGRGEARRAGAAPRRLVPRVREAGARRARRARTSGSWLERFEHDHDNIRRRSTVRPRPAMHATAIGLGVRDVALLAEARPPVRGAPPARCDGRGATGRARTRSCGRG